MLLGAAAFTNEEATMKTLAIMLQLEKCILLVNEKKERKKREREAKVIFILFSYTRDLSIGFTMRTLFLFFSFCNNIFTMTKIVDKAILGIGPIFIVIAVGLLDMCVLAYYLVVFPYSHSWTDTSLIYKIYNCFVLMFTLYIVYSIHFHYYMAITTPPGDMKEYKKYKEETEEEVL